MTERVRCHNCGVSIKNPSIRGSVLRQRLIWLRDHPDRPISLSDREALDEVADLLRATFIPEESALSDSLPDPEEARRWKIRRRRADEGDDSALSYSGSTFLHDEEVEVVEAAPSPGVEREEPRAQRCPTCGSKDPATALFKRGGNTFQVDSTDPHHGCPDPWHGHTEDTEEEDTG